MNIYDSGYDDLKDHARRYGISDEVEETGFEENFDAAFDFFKNEMLSTSEQHMIGDQAADAYNKFREFVPAEGDLKMLDLDGPGLGALTFHKQFLEENHQAILDLQLQHPDAGLKTIDDIMKDAQDRARLARENMSQTSAASNGLGKLGTLAGSVAGFAHDPIILGSFFLGGGKIKGGTKAANAWKAFKTEAAIAAGAETLITPSVMSWKEKIDSPYSLQEAATNIMLAGGFAGVTRASGSYVVDVFEARKAAKALRSSGSHAKADVLDSYADMADSAPHNAHVEAFAKAQQQLEKGKIITQEEIDQIAGGPNSIESVDPRTVQTDAETFQFKSSGNKDGVTDRLEGVKNWDPIKANTSVIWERADGARFIADGHQRLALAKRLIGADQDIGLNAFIMREVDGYSAEAVRDIAAFKNIAEGTGTALDAAKILRSGNEYVGDLPPNSALVRDAQGLAKLSDESFKMVVNETIEARYGAIVGELVQNADEQAAVIRALAKANPANINQASLMVQDMVAAGFTKKETVDLFGGMEITESLFKERAKVIDSVMKQVKKDKSVFKTLAEQEKRIAGAGNQLDRDANLARLSEDERTLATITSLANNRGPVSDAINNAAEQIKSGSSVQQATRDILPAIRSAGDSELLPGGAGRDLPGEGTLTIKQQVDAINAADSGIQKLAVEPPDAPGYSVGTRLDDDGKLITVVNIDRSKVDTTCDNFCFPNLQPTLKKSDLLLRETQKLHTYKSGKKKGQYKPERAQMHEDYINENMVKGSAPAEGEKPVAYLMGGGGASGKGSVLEQLQKNGEAPENGFVHIDPDQAKKAIPEYNEISEKLDYRAAAVTHEESSDMAKMLQSRATEQKLNMIIDKTLGNEKKALKLIKDLKAAGYEVRMVGVTIDPSEALVRGLIRYYGTGRLVTPKAMMKAHKGFNAAHKRYSEEVDEFVLYDNTEKPKPIAVAEGGKLDILDQDAYNVSLNRGKLNEEATTHKQLRESQGLEEELVAKSGRVYGEGDTGRVGADNHKPNVEGNGRSGQNTRGVHDQTKDSGLDLDDPYLNDLHAKELDQLDDLFKQGDVDIPTGIKVIDGEEVIEFKSAREVMDELDAEKKAIDDMFDCMGG